MPKAVIDTNIWISALIGSSLTRPVIKALAAGSFTPIISDKLLKELIDTINEQEIIRLINPDETKELVALISEKSRNINPKLKITACRDAEDNFILSLSVETKSPLVTLDKDLLVLSPKFNIQSPREFLKQLK